MTGQLSAQHTLDFEALAPEAIAHTFVVEAVDSEGSMPPGLATVTVKITVSLWGGARVCVCLCDCLSVSECVCVCERRREGAQLTLRLCRLFTPALLQTCHLRGLAIVWTKMEEEKQFFWKKNVCQKACVGVNCIHMRGAGGGTEEALRIVHLYFM